MRVSGCACECVRVCVCVLACVCVYIYMPVYNVVNNYRIVENFRGRKLSRFGTKQEFRGENFRGLLRSNYYVRSKVHTRSIVHWRTRKTCYN